MIDAMPAQSLRSWARQTLIALGRNLVAGARLALCLPVSRLDFRISAANLTTLVVFNLLVVLIGGMLRQGFPGEVNFTALPTLLFSVPMMLAATLAIAAIYRRNTLMLALAVAWIAGDWIYEIAQVALHWSFLRSEPSLLPRRFATAVGHLYALWVLLVMWRAVQIIAGPLRPQLVYGIGVASLLFIGFYLFVPRAELWQATPPQTAGNEPEIPRVADEELLHTQPTLLAESFKALAPERPGVVDLYFAGVAPYASQDVFERELRAVERLMIDRFDVRGRAITLINSPATLKTTPIATVTHLRATLARVGQVMNPAEDVLLLFLTSHGDRQHELAFDLPPFTLNQLTPTALARMLNDSGIKWKILIISACFSGGYVESLRDPNTMVITASDAEHSSFGCEHGRDWTYFGEALFREALATTRSFTGAFELAAATVRARERRDGLEPSNPQIHVGAAIGEKLKSLEARLEALPTLPTLPTARP